MKTLDRYIGIQILKSYFLVMIILAILFSLIVFIEELDHLGEGRYQLVDVITYTVATLPRRASDLLAITALMGSVIALGSLAGANELTAMRSAGISTRRIAWSAIKTGLLLMLLAILLEQFVVPSLDQYAESRRSLALSEQIALRTAGGFWSHDKTRFINVRNVKGGRVPMNIDIYEFGEQGDLQSFIYAKKADILGDSTWLLYEVLQKEFSPFETVSHRYKHIVWRSFLSASQVDILIVPPESLSPTDLYSYISSLKKRGENVSRHELTFWQKLSLPVITALMVLLSLPFVMGPLRVTGIGQRITVAAVVGMIFYLMNQIAGHVGLLLQINPVLVVVLPMLIMLAIAAFLFSRI